MKKPSPTRKSFKASRGIVLVAGNGDTFQRALTTTKLLRHYGCSLPIEVWHLNDEQPNDTLMVQLLKVKALPRDLSDHHLLRPIDHRRGGNKQFQIKVAAIINSAFEQVIYLDSDNIPTRDLTFLFDIPQYKETGALFWPDFWKTHGENSIHDILDVDCKDEWEQESGQMVINKLKSWYPLQLAWYMNDHHDIYYQFLNGDKDTFRFAWKALKTPFFMNPTFLGMGGTFAGDRFYDLIEKPWEWIKTYKESENNLWLLPEFYIGMGRACMDFRSDQGEPSAELKSFDALLSGLQQLYFKLGGIGGETRI
ncbi:mannosyltransferase putative-domain-containing protein [Halteromyces radiatus]|uniref:mannosyltransferase putative-domain-containing protein n=1 Tax=Halteromyces radiatus TaxID=101107 RepID=UPI0022211DB9|nr:mannosyltransferase putative-domain-containing protein [Halteromyces radiatus]KAI8097722.1 mannosyltransferase putative-domain-containing protein [Halteromyces radiatus]